MKKKLWIFMLSISFALAGCGKDDNEGGNEKKNDSPALSSVISGKIKIDGRKGLFNVTDEIDEVKVFSYVSTESGQKLDLLGSFSVSDGNMSYILPVPPAHFLEPAGESFDIPDLNIKLNVSNPNAQFGGQLVLAGCKDGNLAASILHIVSEESTAGSIDYIYSNQSVRISGSGSETIYISGTGSVSVLYTADVNFKKGWNFFTSIAAKDDVNKSITVKFNSSKPENAIWLLGL